MRFALFAVLAFYTSLSAAENCTPIDVKAEQPGEYIEKMADTLAQIKLYFAKAHALPTKQDFEPVDLLVAFKEIKAAYLCSSETISAYAKSKNEHIALSAKSLALTYKQLGTGVDETINDVKAAIDGKKTKSPGDEAEARADTMLRVKSQWKMAMTAIAMGTHSAVGKENPKTKKMDTLVISKAERDRAIKSLKSQFKLPLGKGTNDPIDVAGDIFFHFLNQDWKFQEAK